MEPKRKVTSWNDYNIVNNWYVQDIPSKRRDKNGFKVRFSDHRGIVIVLNSDPKMKKSTLASHGILITKDSNIY